MSEIKVGDTVWAPVTVTRYAEDEGTLWVTEHPHVQHPFDWATDDDAVIPDVPGLAALAAAVADVGAENLRRHLLDAESQCPLSWNNTVRILGALVAALEVK